MNKILFAIALGLIFQAALSTFSLSSNCRKSGQKLKDLTRPNSEIEFNLIGAYKSVNNQLGNGQFGIVKRLETDGSKSWPRELGGRTAVKLVNLRKDVKVPEEKMLELLRNELGAMHKANGRVWLPKLYACAEEYPIYYIAIEKLHLPLNDPDAIKAFRGFKHWQIMERFLQLFRGLAEMEALNIVHNDVKAANIMAGKSDWTDLRFIDFGFANPLNSPAENVSRCCTPHFTSSNRLSGQFHSIMDDAYALVLTIADMLDEHKILFKDKLIYGFNFRLDIRDSCFLARRDQDCTERLMENAAEIFRKAGFGSYDKSERDLTKMNATTLFVRIIEFSDSLFLTAYSTILKQIERLNDSYAPLREAEQRRLKQLEEERIARQQQEDQRLAMEKKKQAEAEQERIKRQQELEVLRAQQEQKRKDEQLKRQQELEALRAQQEQKRKDEQLQRQREFEAKQAKEQQIRLEQEQKRREEEQRRLLQQQEATRKLTEQVQKQVNDAFKNEQAQHNQGVKDRITSNDIFQQKVNAIMNRKDARQEVLQNVVGNGRKDGPVLQANRVASYGGKSKPTVNDNLGIPKPIVRVQSLDPKRELDPDYANKHLPPSNKATYQEQGQAYGNIANQPVSDYVYDPILQRHVYVGAGLHRQPTNVETRQKPLIFDQGRVGGPVNPLIKKTTFTGYPRTLEVVHHDLHAIKPTEHIQLPTTYLRKCLI